MVIAIYCVAMKCNLTIFNWNVIDFNNTMQLFAITLLSVDGSSASTHVFQCVSHRSKDRDNARIDMMHVHRHACHCCVMRKLAPETQDMYCSRYRQDWMQRIHNTWSYTMLACLRRPCCCWGCCGCNKRSCIRCCRLWSSVLISPSYITRHHPHVSTGTASTTTVWLR